MTRNTIVQGLVAGLAGVAAMTAAEKVEQMFTHRPNSYVPARTLARLLGLPPRPDEDRLLLNWAMHWGQGVLLGVLHRGPGPRASGAQAHAALGLHPAQRAACPQ